MKGVSIKYQILLIVMIPVFLIDVILTSVHVNSSIEKAQELLQSKGEIIAKQIASASEFYLFTGNDEQIQHMLDTSINTNSIIYTSVYDAEGRLVATAEGIGYSSDKSPQYFYYRHAIQTQNIISGDVFDTEIESTTEQAVTLGWIHMYISRQSLQQTKINIFIEGLFFFIAMLAVAVVLTAVISKRITRPVFGLLDHLKKVEHGDLGQVIKDIKSNEIGEVQKGFNSMSQSLLANRMQLNDKIKSATEELMLAISDLEEKNHQLGDARDAAQEANRVKSQFLANISHEIRTPINGIKGFINLLSETGLEQNQKRYADIIRQSTSDLSAIINEVLDFSKIESGKIEIVEEEFDLYELLESTRDSLFTVSMDKGIDLHLTIYSDTPSRLIGDQFRLKQILINLVGNAIKFTDHGFVNITVLLEDENNFESTILFKIEDSGIGISDDNQKHLFQAFSQIESEANRRYSGTGLGLVISKNLSRLMGGDIDLSSDPDSGSVFTLSLPFRSVDRKLETENPFYNQNALILAFNSRCINELQSLYSRIGFMAETQLIEDGTDVNQLHTQLVQNLNYLDVIVFDLRHSSTHPHEVIDDHILGKTRVVVMHYDNNLVDESAYSNYQFIPIINTCNNIKRVLLDDKHEQKEADHQLSEKNAISRKVLIVDDNEINLTLACELTRLWGHSSFAASNAKEAMTLFEKQEYDLILLDIQMPEIDGIELMQMMRSQQPQLTTPIVAITANVLDEEKERLLQLGFDSYLAKPLDEHKLRQLLEQRNIPKQAPKMEESMPEQAALQTDNVSLDFQLSLQLSGNNEQLCLDMLKMLRQGIDEYQQQLRQAIASKSLGKLAYIVHKLQGVTCYTGLPRLKQLLSRYDSMKHIDTDKTLQTAEDIIKELEQINQILHKSVDFTSTEIFAQSIADFA